jgi:hypothetical protein
VTDGAPRTIAGAAAVTDALHRRAHRWQPAFQATGMSAFVALVVTAINTGLDAQLVARWLHAWRLALPAAIAAAYLFRPLAWRIALLTARWGKPGS